VVGIFPNDAAIVRLVGSQLQEQQEEWQLERCRFFSEATMAKIPEQEATMKLTDGVPQESASATTRRGSTITTPWIRSESLFTPAWTCIPKCNYFLFLVWCISGSLLPTLFLVALGVAIKMTLNYPAKSALRGVNWAI